jgi:hypothetical protein
MNRALSDTKIEQELILACARTSIDAGLADRVKDLVALPLDWQYIYSVSHVNGIQPLLYRHLRTVCPDVVPVSVMRQLRELFFRNLARNLSMEEQLGRLLRALDEQGIPAIPYKGPTLAASVYRDVALRVFSDLDIIIQKQDIHRATEALVSLGYAPSFQFGPQQMEEYLRNFYEMPFTGNGTMASVELQWEIAADHFIFPIAPLRIWDDTTATNGSRYQSIVPEKLLLMLCVHGAKDSWERLAWICDISELLRSRAALDWDRLLKLARETGGLRMLGLGLNLAHGLLEAPIPEEIDHHLCHHRVIKNITEQIRCRLFAPDDEPPGVLETCLFYMRARERVSDRIRFCTRTMLRPVPGEWDRLGSMNATGRIANMLTHVVAGLGYGLGFAKQKCREAMQPRNL